MRIAPCFMKADNAPRSRADEIRMFRKMRPVDVARAAGMQNPTVDKILKGERGVTDNTAPKLAVALGVLPRTLREPIGAEIEEAQTAPTLDAPHGRAAEAKPVQRTTIADALKSAGNRLKAIRLLADMSEEEAATALKWSVDELVGYEDGTLVITLPAILEFCSYFEVDPSFIIRGGEYNLGQAFQRVLLAPEPLPEQELVQHPFPKLGM